VVEGFNLGEISELRLDLAAGRLALHNTLNSSWWSWDSGSTRVDGGPTLVALAF
jgi:hypothetical protein